MIEVGTRDIPPLNWDVLVTPGHTRCRERSSFGHETGDLSGYKVNPHLWQAGRRSSQRLYDSQAG